jgi:hypothetical protein
MPYKILLKEPRDSIKVKEFGHRCRRTWRVGGVISLLTAEDRYYAVKAENVLTVEELK